jgi:hypothetical protein
MARSRARRRREDGGQREGFRAEREVPDRIDTRMDGHEAARSDACFDRAPPDPDLE